MAEPKLKVRVMSLEPSAGPADIGGGKNAGNTQHRDKTMVPESTVEIKAVLLPDSSCWSTG